RPAMIEIFILSLHDALPISFGDLDMLLRQFVEESRGDGRLPQAMNAAVRNEPDVQVFLRAGQAHIGQSTLLLQAGPAPFVQRPRSEEHTSELQSRENLVCRL